MINNVTSVTVAALPRPPAGGGEARPSRTTEGGPGRQPVPADRQASAAAGVFQQRSAAAQEPQLAAAVAELGQGLRSLGAQVQISIHADYGVPVIRIVDRESEELIRQLPPEEALALGRFLRDLNETAGSGPPAVEGLLLRIEA